MADVALLMRRAAFGPTAAELAAARKAGYQASLSALFSPPGPDIGATAAPIPELGQDPYVAVPNPAGDDRVKADKIRMKQLQQLTAWWLDRMTVANHQVAERLIFFWHGHWATSATKVKSAQLMLAQHRTIRGARDFADLARRMVVDPALVYWLDGHLNTKNAPNENLARELLELFMLGVGRYTESDVREAGRALTGWRIDLGLERSVFDASNHDGGTKTILGTTHTFDASSLVELLLQQEATAAFIASRMWFRYGSSTTPIPRNTQAKMIAEFPVPMRMLRALFEDDAFIATRGTMVKQPVEWFVGAMRQLQLRLADMSPEGVPQVLDWLGGGLGQRVFAPPSVGGWPAGATWLTSAAAQVRLALAGRMASQFELDRLTPEDVAHILCIDKWTNRTYSVLRNVHNPRLLLALGLASPEYLVT